MNIIQDNMIPDLNILGSKWLEIKKQLRRFLELMFENYPPLADNSFIRKFKKEHNMKISKVKEYMGAIYFEKNKFSSNFWSCLKD